MTVPTAPPPTIATTQLPNGSGVAARTPTNSHAESGMEQLRGLRDLTHLLPKFNPSSPEEASAFLAKTKFYYSSRRYPEGTFLEAVSCTLEGSAGLWFI